MHSFHLQTYIGNCIRKFGDQTEQRRARNVKINKKTFSSFWKDNEGRAQCLWLKEEWGGKWTTERKWSLASVFVDEHAVWAGEGETNIGTRRSEVQEMFWKIELLRMRPSFLD